MTQERKRRQLIEWWFDLNKFGPGPNKIWPDLEPSHSFPLSLVGGIVEQRIWNPFFLPSTCACHQWPQTGLPCLQAQLPPPWGFINPLNQDVTQAPVGRNSSGTKGKLPKVHCLLTWAICAGWPPQGLLAFRSVEDAKPVHLVPQRQILGGAKGLGKIFPLKITSVRFHLGYMHLFKMQEPQEDSLNLSGIYSLRVICLHWRGGLIISGTWNSFGPGLVHYSVKKTS